ncbi:TetR/AcrR family transcriptional regulator C-terminal ligand-binding domain-containing protein [Planomonospora sp. ID67723]|uniref:TetR-like C-terminal domain-containing protein n=1 Tax=Planomonospora sp. ID67723 TaxID=2738134 RepID=UPI0018C40283|nr:TetR-like C-terminal domain-containing protein [Planomonospora sp. ID67723]MBG0826361.1 TetR/AcrR family transcriptional regulator C-terminal ligand-binding domain-containing protein [Planomonospora sp. ID67723]
MAPTHSPPGRPRDRRTHEAILRAAEELVREVGYGSASISAIAARARVGKDAVYRRWSGKPELVYEALFTTVDTGPVPDTGTLSGDVTELARALIEEFAAPAAVAALPGLLADFAADPVLRTRLRSGFLAPARARMVQIFDRAAERGEIGRDVPVDLVLDTLAGAVFFHVGLACEPVTPQLAARLAGIVITGVGRTAPRPHP